MKFGLQSVFMKSLVLGVAVTALVGTYAFAVQSPTGQTPATDGPDHRPVPGHGHRHRHHPHPHPAPTPTPTPTPHPQQFVKSLDLTSGQRAQALQAARTLEPIGRDARREAISILQSARDANPDADRAEIRAMVRPQLQALRERTAAQFAPEGRALIQSLTPDQRAKIDAKMAEHGRTFDAERASKRLGFWLSRPGVRDHLEARATL